MTETTQTISPRPGKRPHRVNVRFTPEEYRHIKEQAQIANKGLAVWLRGLAMGQQYFPVPRFPDDVQRALKSFGGNLNQLSHQANMGRMGTKEVEALRGEVSALLGAIRGQ